jgi:hypothetical protein
MKKRGFFSVVAKIFRNGIKKAGSLLAAKLCRSHSFSIFGVPSGLTPSGDSKRILYPPIPQRAKPPLTIEKKHHWIFRSQLQEMILPEAGILTVDGGTSTNKGGVLSSRGELVTTFLQAMDGKTPKQHDLFNFSAKRFFPKIYKSENYVISLTSGWQGAFYHWVYEVLPRIHLVEKGGFDLNSLYAELTFPFQKESLSLMGIGSHKIIDANIYAGVKARQIVFPSTAEIPTKWSCAFLREKFLPMLSERAPLRLYISRNDATKRRILNEEETVLCLKKYGFEKFELSKLTFKEQAELFQSAEAVVGPHGAGFSHMVFCKPGTPCLEIFSPAYVNPCYWHVSDRVGLKYFYFFGEGQEYPDFYSTHLDPDIIVDLKKLEASLKLMGF